MELLRRTGALDAIQNNDQATAIKRASSEWASLPGSTLPGRKRPDVFQQKPSSAPNPYDGIVNAATPPEDVLKTPEIAEQKVAVAQQRQSQVGAQKQAATPDPYDAIVAAAAPPATGRGAGMARAQGTTYPRRRAQPQGWGGGGTIGQGVSNVSVNAMGGPQPSNGVGGLRQLDDPETARILRAQQQVTAEQTPAERQMQRAPGTADARLLDPKLTENEEVLRRVAAEKDQEDQLAKQTAWEQANKAEIDSQVAQYRKDIQSSGMTKWLTELQGKGAAQLAEFGAGVAKTAGAQSAANALRIRAVAAAQAAQEESADRTQASKLAQDILGGFAGSAPELLLMQAGIPPVATFAAGGGLRAAGMGRPVAPAVTQGALQGAAFEIPAEGVGVRGTLARAGKVGLGTAGVDLATGAPLGQALKSGVTNAAMVGVPGLIAEGTKAPAPEVVPREASIAPVIADARAERVRAATEGTQPTDIAPAQPGTAEAVKLGGAQGRLSTLPSTPGEIAPAPAGTQSAIELAANRVVGPTKPVEAAPDEGAKLNRWSHTIFGTKPVDAQTADAQAQAEENAPFKVVDRRGQVASEDVPQKPMIRLSPRNQTNADPEQSIRQGAAQSETAPTSTPASTATKAGEESSQTADPYLTPKEKERSFPQTLAATGREKGTDLYYQEITDKASVDKANARIAKDPEAARKWAVANLEKGSGKEAIATGLRVADTLAGEAAKESDPAKAAEKHLQASELYSKTSARLTEAGQTVQAASLARRYSPTGAVLEAIRVANKTGIKLKAEDIQSIRDLATKHQDSESRISDLEKRIDELQKQQKPSAATKGKIAIKIEPLKVRLDTAADQARMRIADTKAKMESGELEFRNTGPIPGHISQHLGDYAIIGASKLAKGGLSFAQWSAEMIKDLGEEIKPHLDRIFQAARKQLDEERQSTRLASSQRGAAKELTKQGVEPTPVISLV